MTNQWTHAICSVCLEAPHKAVLLLCASHDKGCRPYMCGTSSHHSNCFDLFKKTQSKPAAFTSSIGPQQPSCKLSCPLCRSKVKGWKVMKLARQYLNGKKRSCVQNGCSFIGAYKELKKHVKANHHMAQPSEVDLSLQAGRRVQPSQPDLTPFVGAALDEFTAMARRVMNPAFWVGGRIVDSTADGRTIEDFRRRREPYNDNGRRRWRWRYLPIYT